MAIVTRVYAAAIRQGREPTGEELQELEKAFSRSGFTQGYYLGRQGPEMFGTRMETEAPEELYAAARESYRRENPLVGVDLAATFRAREPSTLRAADGQGRAAYAQGPVPEPARSRATTAEEAEAQLSKTGGTPYFIRSFHLELDPGLALPKSGLNQLRRAVLEDLTGLRGRPPRRRVLETSEPPSIPNSQEPPGLIFSLQSIDQLTGELWTLPHRFIDLPAGEFGRDTAKVRQALADGARFRVVLPRICWDSERHELEGQLAAIAGLGVADALVPTWDLVGAARSFGFALHGDFGLGAYNSATLAAMAELGFTGATASFELKLPMVRDLAKPLAVEAIVYGRLPLMMLEQAPGGRETACLTDRLNVTFPLRPAPGGRWELLNSQVLYLADKPEWRALGLTAGRLLFTDESPQRCVQVAREYLSAGRPPKHFTRGLYYRDVE